MKIPSVERIKDVLYSNAEDLGNPGHDHNHGHGRLTTDFLDVGRIVDKPIYVETKEPIEVVPALDGCKGIALGMAVGAAIFIILILIT
jgi:hypothetical protein